MKLVVTAEFDDRRRDPLWDRLLNVIEPLYHRCPGRLYV
jgi:hypothetical protein